MTLNRTNVVLASLLVIVVILTATTRVDYSKPNIEILPDMKYTPAWMAYARNPVFANGRTLQTPVPGTIARGHMPLHFTATKEDAARAGEEIANPYHNSSATDSAKLNDSIARGGDVYRVFCVACHGAAGKGDGPVTTRGFPPPPSLLTGKSLQMKDGQLFHILTYGQGSMTDFAAELALDRRWDVVNYVRDLQAKASVAAQATESVNVGDTSERDEVVVGRPE